MFSHIGLAQLCGWFGITRQAYYSYTWKAYEEGNKHHVIIDKVKQIREKHPRIGTRKLFDMLQPFFKEHKIKIGRDALFNLLYTNHLLVRKRKRKISTTNSYHRFRKYPNLIRDIIPTAINQLWVSDITYWKIEGKHVYISFITDVYSHKIVGFHVAQTLETIESIQALKMALSNLKTRPENLIHHSDRGIQYCSNSYVKLLQDYNLNISMTENGDPLENAIAERVNGIIKEEYLQDSEVKNIKEAKEVLCSVVKLYNEERPHNSIGNYVPNEVHMNNNLKIKRLWKNYYKKQDSNSNSTFSNSNCFVPLRSTSQLELENKSVNLLKD
jgi:transposase InsO family protein